MSTWTQRDLNDVIMVASDNIGILSLEQDVHGHVIYSIRICILLGFLWCDSCMIGTQDHI